MPQWLINLTQPQATLGSGVVTFLGAICAVLLGWMLFSGKIRDMKSTIQETDDILKEHQFEVKKTLDEIESKLSSLTASAAQIRADVADNQAFDTDEADEKAEVDGNELSFEDLSSSWWKIRDTLESIASDPEIDGRTAAKYARIDRRSYSDLIESLDFDGKLGSDGDRFLEAAKIWLSHRPRKKKPSQEVIMRMVALANSLVEKHSNNRIN
ncbi:hypothetical protein ACMA5I_00435 [Paracoccaceae bacterium GXU_MW_L88]